MINPKNLLFIVFFFLVVSLSPINAQAQEKSFLLANPLTALVGNFFENVTDGFRNLTEVTFDKFFFSSSPEKVVETSPPDSSLTEKENPNDSVVLVKTEFVNLESLKSDLKKELQDYILLQIAQRPEGATTVVYQSLATPSTPTLQSLNANEVQTIVYRSITRQSDSDASRSSVNISNLTDGGSFTDATISGASTFSGTTGTFSSGLTVSGGASVTGDLTINGNTVITGGSINIGDKVITEGDIGVGTTTPYGKLSVQGTVTTQPSFVLYGADSQTADLVSIYDNPTSNTNLLTITSAGNVGIGTTSPDTPLHIESAITYALRISNPVTGTAGAQAYNNANKYASFGILASTTSGVDSHLFSNKGIFAAEQGLIIMTDGDNGQGGTDAIEFRAGGYRTANLIAKLDYTGLILGKNYTLTATPPSNGLLVEGNVGIGTTSPYAKLSVVGGTSGTAFAVDTITGFTGNLLDLKVASTTKFSINQSGGLFSLASSTIGDGSTTGGLTVSGNSTTTGNAYFAGNVGIGTTSPFAKLSINNTGNNTIPFAIKTNGSVGNYTATNTGIFVYDAAGEETLRIWASDPDPNDSNFNDWNLYIGAHAGESNTTDNVSGGYHNTGVGYRALTLNTTGKRNSAFGDWSLSSNTTGYENSAFGEESLYSNTTGKYNSAFGEESLFSNTTGYDNSAFGEKSLFSNTTGHENSAFGVKSLRYNTTGTLNTAVGYKTGLNPSDEANGRYQIVADTYMTLIGYGATKDNLSTLTNGIAIGADAHVLQSNQAVLGNDNITTTLLKGSVGIGTTSPWAKLSVAGSAGGTVPLFTVSSSTSAFATSTVFNIDSNGFVGIGRESPVYTLDVLAQGTGVIARFQSANATGCTLATDGTISCTSDERMKKNIEDLTYGLETVTNLRPVLFNWNYEDGSTLKNLGFLAQDVELLIPKLVVTDKEGMKSLNTTGMIPILVKAVQEIWEKITPVLAWFNFHDDLLCVDDVCVTKEQFKNILLNAGVGATVINTEVTNAEDEEVIETATTTEEVTEETTVEETASTDSASSLQATPEVIEELPIPSEQDSDTESSIHDLPAEPTDSGQIGTEPVTPEPTPETLEP